MRENWHTIIIKNHTFHLNESIFSFAFIKFIYTVIEKYSFRLLKINRYRGVGSKVKYFALCQQLVNGQVLLVYGWLATEAFIWRICWTTFWEITRGFKITSSGFSAISKFQNELILNWSVCSFFQILANFFCPNIEKCCSVCRFCRKKPNFWDDKLTNFRVYMAAIIIKGYESKNYRTLIL